MPPYEAEVVIGTLVKSWIKTRIDRLKEWVDKNFQQEAWNVQANKERVRPSMIEIFRILDETVEAFFLLPILIQPTLVSDLMIGLDRCIQQYIMKTKSGCGKLITEIVTRINPAQPIDEHFQDTTTYSQEDIGEVRDLWAVYFLKV